MQACRRVVPNGLENVNARKYAVTRADQVRCAAFEPPARGFPLPSQVWNHVAFRLRPVALPSATWNQQLTTHSSELPHASNTSVTLVSSFRHTPWTEEGVGKYSCLAAWTKPTTMSMSLDFIVFGVRLYA